MAKRRATGRLAFESPVVKDYPKAAPSPDGGGLALCDASATTKWLVRADPDGAVADCLGAPFGSSAEFSGGSGESRGVSAGALVLGSRPGEWIVVGSAAAVADVIGRLADLFAGGDDAEGTTGAGGGAGDAELVTALDWTHGRALFRLSGAESARALEKVCSLDWSDAMTPDGAVASASVAKVTCDIARADVGGAPSYLIFCDRSFGQYMFDALLDAGDEFGISATEPAPAVG